MVAQVRLGPKARRSVEWLLKSQRYSLCGVYRHLYCSGKGGKRRATSKKVPLDLVNNESLQRDVGVLEVLLTGYVPPQKVVCADVASFCGELLREHASEWSSLELLPEMKAYVVALRTECLRVLKA
ncbi:hypothetical protein GCM10009624_27010 [Gordonia sinesedis]